MRITNYINGVEGVLSGGTATVNIPCDRRYHALKVILGATIGGVASTDPVAIIDYARLLVNGVVLRDLNPLDYINIARLNGIVPGAGELPFYFSEPWRASVVGEEATSWDLFGQSKATLEIKFKGGLTAPTCAVAASFDYGRNVADGKLFLSIVKQLKQTYNAPQGRYDITTLPKSFPIQRVLIQVSAGTVNGVEVYRDNEKIVETTKEENKAFLADYGIFADNFSFPVVFDFEQQISSALIVNREMNIRVDSTAANTLSAIVEFRVPSYQ